MSKNTDEPIEEEPKDEATAKFLHKIAENGKDRGIPESLVAHYEKKAWEATKSDEKYTSCEKCGMPPPPPIDMAKKCESEPCKVCKNCGNSNKKEIGLESEIVEMTRKEEILKKQDERKSLKRTSDVIASSSPVTPSNQRRVVAPPTHRPMARKVAPQPNCSKMLTPQAPPLLLQSKSSAKKSKKPKIVPEKEPDFLQKLFKIGANPV